MDLQDYYMDREGRKWLPQVVGEGLVYLRSQHYGHIRNMVVPFESGTVDFSQAKHFNEKAQCISYIFKQEQKIPEKFYPSKVREIMAKYQK